MLAHRVGVDLCKVMGEKKAFLGDLNGMHRSIEGERKISNMLLNILCKFLSSGPSLPETKNIPVSAGQWKLVKE